MPDTNALQSTVEELEAALQHEDNNIRDADKADDEMKHDVDEKDDQKNDENAIPTEAAEDSADSHASDEVVADTMLEGDNAVLAAPDADSQKDVVDAQSVAEVAGEEDEPAHEQSEAPESKEAQDAAEAQDVPELPEVDEDGWLREGENEAEACVSRRTSAVSDTSEAAVPQRRTSLRTEALIHAAARAVVATIERRGSGGAEEHSFAEAEGHEANEHEDSLQELAQEDAASDHVSVPEEEDEENDNDLVSDHGSTDKHTDDGADEPDDVFSDGSHRSQHSQRTSLGSFDGHDEKEQQQQQQQPMVDDDEGETGSVCRCHHTPRVSGVSRVSRVSDVSQDSVTTGISHMSQYDRGAAEAAQMPYVPRTLRTVSRPAFRSPSEMRALQMSSPSPSPSLFMGGGGSSGGGGRRRTQPTQFSSPRSSPRFKVFKPEPAPLVLLHATLMPSRWTWGAVLDRLGDEAEGRHQRSVSPALQHLQSAWCRLHDVTGGDTVAERGVLLPHPQNDYEVLEERLLEALELPARRRARILECGHYLGPADDEDEDEDEMSDSEDDDRRDKTVGRHWCATCRSEIQFEALGAERVFRVKVYASNGLMTAGAWAACWREMERVDVEIEPLVLDAALLRELTRLRARQEDELRVAVADDVEEEDEEDEEEDVTEQEEHFLHDPPFSPLDPPAVMMDHVEHSERRRREAEARLREIYGRTPPVTVEVSEPGLHDVHEELHAAEQTTHSVPETVDTHDSFLGPLPSSPSAAAFARREERRRQFQAGAASRPPPMTRSRRSSIEEPVLDAEPALSSPAAPPHPPTSLPELLLAAAQVILRDHRQVAITLVSAVVILVVALRLPVQGATSPAQTNAMPGLPELPAMAVKEPAACQQIPAVAEMLQASTLAASASSATTASASTRVEVYVQTVTEKQTVKVYETVTERVQVTAVPEVEVDVELEKAEAKDEAEVVKDIENVEEDVVEDVVEESVEGSVEKGVEKGTIDESVVEEGAAEEGAIEEGAIDKSEAPEVPAPQALPVEPVKSVAVDAALRDSLEAEAAAAVETAAPEPVATASPEVQVE